MVWFWNFRAKNPTRMRHADYGTLESYGLETHQQESSRIKYLEDLKAEVLIKPEISYEGDRKLLINSWCKNGFKDKTTNSLIYNFIKSSNKDKVDRKKNQDLLDILKQWRSTSFHDKTAKGAAYESSWALLKENYEYSMNEKSYKITTGGCQRLPMSVLKERTSTMFSNLAYIARKNWLVNAPKRRRCLLKENNLKACNSFGHIEFVEPVILHKKKLRNIDKENHPWFKNNPQLNGKIKSIKVSTKIK